MKILKLAVIGKDVSKSVSPEIHTFIAARMGNSIHYEKISIPEEQFEGSIGEIIAKLDGFNVTIPYKLSIIHHLKSVSGDAKAFGAVNTVTCRDLCGHNTDGMGFMMMLENNGICVKGKKVLLLGAGGAGRSVAKKLLDAGAKVHVYDKTYANSLRLAQEFNGVIPLKEVEVEPYYLIINATGVGMHKTEGMSPVNGEILNLCEVAVDLIYTPKKSKFLEIAEGFGKRIINGEGMLFYQAYFAECIYFGVPHDNALARQLFEEYIKEN